MNLKPRSKSTILDALVSRVVTKSSLTDLEKGSSFLMLLEAVADDIAYVEERLFAIRNAFDLDATGTDLDDRVADLPPSGLARLPASSASGAILELQRASSAGTFLVPAGTIYGRTDDPTLLYVQDTDVTFANGSTVYPASGGTLVRVTAATPGKEGNAAEGLIKKVVSGPAEVTKVTQKSALTGGTVRETDAELRKRAKDYLGGHRFSVPARLRFLAESFVSSSGIRVKHASVWESPTVPGYAELVVDDGTGLAGFAKPGEAVTGFVPVNGINLILFEAPATAPFTSITRNGVTIDVTDWPQVPERGLLFVPPGKLVSGDNYSLPDYTVLTGPLAELQVEVEGDPANPDNKPGWRAAGTRVRVLPPTVEFISFTLNLTVAYGQDLNAIRDDVKLEIIDHLQALAPGETLFLSALIAGLMAIPGVVNITFSAPTGDYPPTDARSRLGTSSGLITVT